MPTLPPVSHRFRTARQRYGGLPRLTAHGSVRRAMFLVACALAACAVAACGHGGGPAYDMFGAYNAVGGARRGNDFSRYDVAPVSGLAMMEFKGLPGGILAPPLELPLGRMAVISRSDSVTMLAVVFRDSIIWRYRYPANQHPMPGLAADSAGTLYAVTTHGILQAFSPEGKLLWEHPTVADSGTIVVPSPLLALANGVVVGNSAGSLAWYDRTGKQIWRVTHGISLSDQFAADPAVGLALPATHNSYDFPDTLLALDPANGMQRWAAAAGGRIVQGPIITNKLVVVGIATLGADERRLPSIAAFTHAGALAWRASLPLMPRGIASDAEGNIYVSCSGVGVDANGGAMVALDSAGHRRWRVALESGIPAAAAVSAHSLFFVSRRQGRTGLFTYSHEGVFNNFVSIDVFPDVLALGTISSLGELVLAGLDRPALLRGR